MEKIMNYNFGDKIRARNSVTGEVIDLIAEPNHEGVAFYDHKNNRRFIQDEFNKICCVDGFLVEVENANQWEIL
jgi:hypothetical protein